MSEVIRPGNLLYRTPSCRERCVLLKVEGGTAPQELYIMLARLNGATWLLGDVNGAVSETNLEKETYKAVGHAQPLPPTWLPCGVPVSPLAPTFLSGMRAEAAAHAAVYGLGPRGLAPAVSPVAGISSSSSDALWRYADPSHVNFGLEVDLNLLMVPDVLKTAGGSGLLTEKGATETQEEEATFVERVAEQDVKSWLLEKATATGRDKRLSSLAPWPKRPHMFQDVVNVAQQGFVLPPVIFGTSPASAPELADAIASSGLQPTAFALQLIIALGIGPNSGLAKEIENICVYFFLAGSVDGIDILWSAAAEHWSRRFLQICRACRKNGKAPDFNGLDQYMAHTASASTQMRTPGFDKWIADEARTEGLFLKNLRMNKDEHLEVTKKENAEKNKDKKNSKGKNGKDEE